MTAALWILGYLVGGLLTLGVLNYNSVREGDGVFPMDDAIAVICLWPLAVVVGTIYSVYLVLCVPMRFVTRISTRHATRARERAAAMAQVDRELPPVYPDDD